MEVDWRDSLRVVKAVAEGITSDGQEVAVLLPIIFVDDDPTVVSTAALEYSVLYPLVRHDPMTGVKQVLALARDLVDVGWQAGAVLGGAVVHGDYRVPKVLDRAWVDLDEHGKFAVTGRVRPGLLLTGTIEFYLRWLEDPIEQELGMPAATLAALPTIARHDGIVREGERRLPANYQSTADEDHRNPPIRGTKQWTTPDYGRTILPRLEAVWKREGRPEEMRMVMQAWSP